MYHSRAAGNNFILYFITFVADINFVIAGVVMGWPQSVLPQLLSANSSIPLTYDEGAWVAGISYVGMFTGGIVSLFVASRLGVRRTLLIGVVPCLAGWIIIAVASSYWELLVARFILGCMVGMCCDQSESYIAELAPSKIRGRLCASCSVSVHLGLVLSFAIDSYLPITTTAGIYIGVSIIYSIIFFTFAPETPFWYAKRGDHEKSRNCLRRLRGTNDIGREYEEVLNFVAKDTISFKSNISVGDKLKQILSRVENRKAIFIVILLTTGQQFTGIQAMNNYAELLFERSVTIIPANYVAILLGLCELVFTIVGSAVIDVFGRKKLYIGAGCICASLMTLMGVYFHFQYVGLSMDGWKLLPIVVILLFVITYSIGMASIAAVFAGECYSSEMRVMGMAIKTLFFCTSGFLVTKLWQVIASAAGDQYSFWTVAIITYLYVLILYYIQPETKGKTLAEIQVALSGKSYWVTPKSKENVYDLQLQ